jgi:hypothetical protein
MVALTMEDSVMGDNVIAGIGGISNLTVTVVTDFYYS